MPGLNRKVRIATDWFLHLLFPPELAQTKLVLDSAIRDQHCEPGDIIFHQGDLGDSVYVIEEGECEILREQNGQQQLLATLGRGEYFGEMAVLSEGSRNATVRARTAMAIVIIPKIEFNKLRRSVPTFGKVFIELASERASAGSPPSSKRLIPATASV